jgi:hypothetical protein
VPGEDAAEGVADGPLAAVMATDELVVPEVVRQLLEPRQPRQPPPPLFPRGCPRKNHDVAIVVRRVGGVPAAPPAAVAPSGRGGGGHGCHGVPAAV